MILSIAASLPGAPWSAFLVAGGAAVIGGLGAGALMNLVLRTFGHDGYVSESRDERAVRVYMEKSKQGMKE